MLAEVLANHLAGAMAQAASCAASAPASSPGSDNEGASLHSSSFRPRWERAESWPHSGPDSVRAIHFHFAGGNLRVHRSRRAQHHFAFHAHHVLGPHFVRAVVRFRADCRDCRRPASLPVWSRRSRKMKFPRSRRTSTQPARKTVCPACSLRKLAAVVRSLSITKKVKFHSSPP